MPTKYLKDKSLTENLYLAIFNELPECDMEASDLDSLFEILDTLTSTETYVIKRRFGLLGMPRRAQREIGASLGVGAARIGQIESKAIRKLRFPYRAKLIKILFASRAELRAEIQELKNQLRDAEIRARHADAKLVEVAYQFNKMAEVLGAEKINQSKSDVLNLTIDDLDLPSRTRQCLLMTGARTVGDIVQKPRADIMRIRNIGNRSLEEIERRLDKIDLSIKP